MIRRHRSSKLHPLTVGIGGDGVLAGVGPTGLLSRLVSLITGGLALFASKSTISRAALTRYCGSDKVSSEVTNQIDSLRHLIEKDRRAQERDRKTQEKERKALDQKFDMILQAIGKMSPEAEFVVRRDKPMKSEEEDTGASVQPSIEDGDDSEEIDDRPTRDVSMQDTVLRRKERSVPPVDATYLNEIAKDIDTGAPKQYYVHGGEDTFGDAVKESSGNDVIPLRHTTGSHYVLQWPSVMKVWQGASVKPESVRKFDPYTLEMDRGILHLHGTGQGYEQVSLDVNYTRETPSSVSGSDSPESVASPIVEKSWGLIGSSPDPETKLHARHNPHDLRPDRSPPFDETTVRRLANVYMTTMNIMHPIITKYGLEQLIRLFLKEVAAKKGTRSEGRAVAGFTRHSGKRKWDSDATVINSPDDIRLPYTMSTATMLLILALGKICEWKEPVPAPPAAPDGPAAVSPPSITFSQSPSPGQRPAQLPKKGKGRPLPSAGHTDSSSDVHSGQKYPADVKNVDVIPGLAYFALAANILGDHDGENSLQMVQACLLAGLYHGQLGRPLQSYNYIFKAGVCMHWIMPQS